MSNFVSRFKDVDLYQGEFSAKSVKAVKEIYAEKNGLSKRDIKELDFQKCIKYLRGVKQA